MFELAEHILVGDSTSPHALNKCNHSCTNINIKLKYNLTACLHFVCITFYFGIFSFAISVFMFFYYVFSSCLLLCILSISDCVQFSHYSVVQKREYFNVFANLMKYFGITFQRMNWQQQEPHRLSARCDDNLFVRLRLLNRPDFVHLFNAKKNCNCTRAYIQIPPSIMANEMAESKYWCLVVCFCSLWHINDVFLLFSFNFPYTYSNNRYIMQNANLWIK